MDIQNYPNEKFEIINELLNIEKFSKMSKTEFIEIYKKILFVNKLLLKYGSKDQINRFIYDLFSLSYDVVIYSIEDILLFFIYWYLDLEMNFDEDSIIDQINNLICDIDTKNSHLLILISTRMSLIKNNPSHHNIFDFLEHLNIYDNFHHTSEIKILCNLLINIYNNEISSLFNFENIMLLFDKSCRKFFTNVIANIKTRTFSNDLFYEQIFVKNDIVELFTEGIIKLNLLQLNISDKSVTEDSLKLINKSLFDLSEYILKKNDPQLYKLFIIHHKILHKTIL